MTFAAVALSLLYWLRKKNSGRFNTFLFISYLALLLLLAGIRFYWSELLNGGRAVIIGTGLAEFAGYALLLYYLPATINHIIGRKWNRLGLISTVIASAVYFALGAVYLLTGFLKQISLAAAFIYFLALAVILSDIVRSLPQIRRGTTRITVLSVTLLTVAFLPLVMAGRILAEVDVPWSVSRSIRFLFFSLYYLWMAITGIVFYLREMGTPEPDCQKQKELPDELPLTDRERDIAMNLVQGLTYGEIAENLGISPNTVRNHVANVYKKLSVRSKVELIGVIRGDREY